MVTPGAKKLLMVFLVASFLVQTTLVYTDPPRPEPMTGAALEGAKLWHEHNCQSCHQLYGFGGFLGPDLTNFTARTTEQRLREVMTGQSAQMPAFDLGEDGLNQMWEFLAYMNETGWGEARRPAPPGDSPAARFPARNTRHALPNDVGPRSTRS